MGHDRHGGCMQIPGNCHNIPLVKIFINLKIYLVLHFKEALGMIKFLTGSCLSGLGIVLKEP
jgi:hypothetical protein